MFSCVSLQPAIDHPERAIKALKAKGEHSQRFYLQKICIHVQEN